MYKLSLLSIDPEKSNKIPRVKHNHQTNQTNQTNFLYQLCLNTFTKLQTVIVIFEQVFLHKNFAYEFFLYTIMFKIYNLL